MQKRSRNVSQVKSQRASILVCEVPTNTNEHQANAAVSWDTRCECPRCSVQDAVCLLTGVMGMVKERNLNWKDIIQRADAIVEMASLDRSKFH